MKIKNNKNKEGGFTLIELVVTIFIFAMMTTLLLAKYGKFDQGVLLTNLAYDVALTIRNAQSYGLNVKDSPVGSGNKFEFGYGVHFNKTSDNKSFAFFVDANGNNMYDPAIGEKITMTSIKRGSYISDICVDDGCGNHPNDLDITFKRPDPNAIIKSGGTKHPYAEITLKSTDGSTKKVQVRSTGQIAITD